MELIKKSTTTGGTTWPDNEIAVTSLPILNLTAATNTELATTQPATSVAIT